MNKLNRKRVTIANEEANNRSNFFFNCWGATLYILDVIDELEWVENIDISEFIECDTEKIDNKIEVGDILVLFNSDRIIHTAVFTAIKPNGENQLFHKVGGERAEFTDLEGVLDVYYDHSNYEIVRKIR